MVRHYCDRCDTVKTAPELYRLQLLVRSDQITGDRLLPANATYDALTDRFGWDLCGDCLNYFLNTMGETHALAR
jgi:hypothetical protein